MKRTEFARCTPESVGIPSGSIEAFLDALEYGGFTQMHGLMIMRHGKICAEGWWKPFAPGLRHCDHSLSKTYTATAVGIAEREGLLSLSDKVADFFPEKLPEHPSERLRRMTVRDLLVMGGGMELGDPSYPENWLEIQLALPIDHEPGTFWRYDSHGTTLLSAIVERVSGMDMIAYLTPRLFDKIGIDVSHVMCNRAGDGTCIGGSGMFTTTEDNLRLMKLYLNGGVWDGERILSEQFVKDATGNRLDNAEAHAHTPWIYDNRFGYGYQIWCCRRPGSYRADGAFGQFSVVLPDLDMIVSINESAYLGDHMSHAELHLLKGKIGEAAPVHGPQCTLNALFEILIPAVRAEVLPESAESARLARRMASLGIAHPSAGRGADWTQRALKLSLAAEGKGISFGLLFGMGKHRKDYPGAERMTLDMKDGMCELRFEEDGVPRRLFVNCMGGFSEEHLDYAPYANESLVASAGWWEGEDFCLSVYYIESETENRFRFSFRGDIVDVEKWIESGVCGAREKETARYRMA